MTIRKSEYVTELKHDNTQQIEKRQKIKVKSITFLWSESRKIKDNTSVTTWKEANKMIKDIAFSIENDGYNKTAFLVEWVDGQTYKGRIDVTTNDIYKEAPLSEHIENFALGMAGMKKPYHWTQEKYKKYLNALKINCEEWKNFLDTYMLYDE